MAERISGSEELTWQLLETVEPWGEKRADYRAAVICWTICSANWSGRGRRPQLKDFLKYFDFEPEQERDDDSWLGKIK